MDKDMGYNKEKGSGYDNETFLSITTHDTSTMKRRIAWQK